METEKSKNPMPDSFLGNSENQRPVSSPCNRDGRVNVRWPTWGKAMCFLWAYLGPLERTQVRNFLKNPTQEDWLWKRRIKRKGWSQIRTWGRHIWSTGELTTNSKFSSQITKFQRTYKSNPQEKNVFEHLQFRMYEWIPDVKYAGHSLI